MIPILSIADLVLIVTKHTDLQSIITFMLQKISTHIVHITNGLASNVVYYKRECGPWQVSFLRCHQMGKTRRIAVAPIRTFASPTPWPPTTPPPIAHLPWGSSSRRRRRRQELFQLDERRDWAHISSSSSTRAKNAVFWILKSAFFRQICQFLRFQSARDKAI